MLGVTGLTAGYGRIEVLHNVDLAVDAGEIVAIVGANGAGKTTLMNVLAGIHPPFAGSITYEGNDITAMPAHVRVASGIVLVPQGRRIFGPLTVEDNLRLGAYRSAADRSDLTAMEEMFPILAERRGQGAGGLSGGQQQMLAIARALMARPRLLLLDEPSMGLAPLIVEQIFDALRTRHKREGTTIVVVEQNVSAALAFADRGIVMETGRIVAAGPSADLLNDTAVQDAFLGAEN
ncbi:MAG: ABC transporter ATP-binding protein [Pseudomonadota bacterium]